MLDRGGELVVIDKPAFGSEPFRLETECANQIVSLAKFAIVQSSNMLGVALAQSACSASDSGSALRVDSVVRRSMRFDRNPFF